MTKPEFDSFAECYEEALAKGLGVTGEDSTYYAKGRVDALAALVDRSFSLSVARILDFGCGTGGSRAWLYQVWPHAEYVGYDVSEESLQIAEKRNTHPNTSWSSRAQGLGAFDVVLTNGVFHHIPPAQRAAAFTVVRKALQPHGVFGFFENNPWNPGTRYIMSKVEFDRDAITITPREARRLLAENGLQAQRFASLFYFPASLALLRPLERYLTRIPLGGQYLYLCQKANAL